jgi:hypothetical protein
MMSKNHQHVLEALFAHPVSANIDPRDVLALIEELGGEISHGGHGNVVVRLAGHTHGFQEPRHSLTKEEVVEWRKFLALAGFEPAV